ncbi:Eukaryotic initiation factor 4A-15 [Bienertia sinuspersici]
MGTSILKRNRGRTILQNPNINRTSYRLIAVVLISFKYKLRFFVFSLRNLTHTLINAVMAGIAPEGSQYDARQFDNKMNDCFLRTKTIHHFI